MAILSSSAFVISILVLVSETLKTKPGFKLEANVLGGGGGGGSTNAADKDEAEEDEDLEVYYDVDEEGKKAEKPKKVVSGSWVYLDNNSTNPPEEQQKDDTEGKERPSKSANYDLTARNPQFCNADQEELWELALIGAHFHPTAKLFSEKIRTGESVEYDGNPLDDFTVKRFLDRFVFRNPKQNVKNTKETASVKTRVFGREQKKKGLAGALGERELLEQPVGAVPADEQFIYRFLAQKKAMKLKERGGRPEDDDDSDIESVTSLEFNDILDNYESYTHEDDAGVEEIDFAKNYQENSGKEKKAKGKKKTGKKAGEHDDDEEADFDEEFDEDDFEGDGEDDDFLDNDDDDQMEFSDDDDDAGEGDFGEDGDEDEDEDGDFTDLSLSKGKRGANKARNAAPFAGKKGFSRITNDIFADAEEFAHILEQNEESDSDFDELEAEGGEGGKGTSSKKNNKGKKNEGKGKKRKGGRPSLGRKAAMRRKKPKLSPDDL